jgi:putative phage-type endonuclease
MVAAARKVGTYPPGSPEWHAARVGKMSGSRIAAAAGLSPWESPFSLWHRMAGNIGEAGETRYMRWGTILEPPILGEFARLHPELHVHRNPGTWLNKAEPWMLANPDGLFTIGTGRRLDGVVEIKTAGYPDGWGKEGTEEIPIQYYCQVIWYLHVLGLKWAIVAVLIGGNDYREYSVNYDADAAGELITIGRQFMDSLEAGIPPDLDGGAATMQTIKELHPDIDGTSVDVPDSIGWRLVHEKSRLVVPTERFDAAKAELAECMGNAKSAYWNGVKIADRRSRNGGIPYIQLSSHLPAPTRVPDDREAAMA